MLLNFKSFFKSITIVFCAHFILSGCHRVEIDYKQFIPADASMVTAVNTDAIFSDAFFDLITNSSLTESFGKGPIGTIFKDPANAGLKRLTTYYLFTKGESLAALKIGAVLPIEDEDKFKHYLIENFEVEIKSEGGKNIAQVNDKNVLIWDNQTAIYYASFSKNELVQEAKDIFKVSPQENLLAKDTTFYSALSEPTHIMVWLKNDIVYNVVNEAFSGLGLDLKEVLNVNTDKIESAKTVLLANFNEGAIQVKQRFYLNKAQLQVYSGHVKENNITPLTKIAAESDPLFAASISLNKAGLVSMMKDYGVEEAWEKQLKNASFKIKLNQLYQFLDGDVLVVINGLEEVTKNINKVTLDDEGNDVVKTYEVKKAVPNMVMALSLKSPKQFASLLNLFFSSAKKENGFMTFDGEFFFAVQHDLLLVTTSTESTKQLQKLNNALQPHIVNAMQNNNTTAYVNVGKTIDAIKSANPIFKTIKAGSELHKLEYHEKGVSEQGFIESETIVQFYNNDNSFITLVKVLTDFGSVIAPVVSNVL